MVPNGYFAILEKDEDTILVQFPQHPTINTFGYDWEHAEEMAQEALSAALEADFERGYKLPPVKKPRAKKGRKVVFVPLEPEVRTAYMLRAWRKEAGLTQKQMAKRLGVSYQAYQRMERPGRSNLTVNTLERVARALDKQLLIEMQ